MEPSDQCSQEALHAVLLVAMAGSARGAAFYPGRALARQGCQVGKSTRGITTQVDQVYGPVLRKLEVCKSTRGITTQVDQVYGPVLRKLEVCR